MTAGVQAAIGFDFPRNDADEDEGLGNAGIETYRDKPYASAAREVGQNSRDASEVLPVRISFDVIEVPFNDVPAIDELQKAVRLCLAKAKASADAKEIAHFEQADRVLQAGPLKILRIADANTTGLRGPSKSGTPFHSLIKGSGVSVKENDASGGSFGIGKNAVFAVSDVQTVLYSTVYSDPDTGQKNFLAQGRAVLVSHQQENGENVRAAAYWGVRRFQPISRVDDAPAWLRREDVGTSVFALGFREMPQWQHRIAYALLENFFYAIHAGEMEFAVGNGSIIITKASISSLFDDPAIAAAAAEDNHDQEFSLARLLYRCLVSPEAKEDDVQIPGLGRVTIRVLVEEGLPKKVCIIRNGMVITDSLENFGDRFARFAMYRDFVAIVVPKDKEGRTLVKRLENPRHDGLSAERLPDEAQRTRARNIMKRLAKKIRETIKAHSLIAFERELAADEMRDYFQRDANQAQTGGTTGQDDPETIRYTIEPRRKPVPPRAAAPGEGLGGGPKPGPKPGPGPGPKPGPRPRPRVAGTGTDGVAHPVELSGVRNFRQSGAPATRRSIFFTPAEGGNGTIAIEASGMNESEDLVIASTSPGVVNSGRIRHELTTGERTRIDVEFAEPYDGPIELRVSIDPEREAANEA